MEHPAIRAGRIRGSEPANILALRQDADAMRKEIGELRAAIIEQREAINLLSEAADGKPKRGRPRKEDQDEPTAS